MDAKEKIDCRVKSFVDLKFSQSFESSSELSVRVLGDVGWSEYLRIHKFLEGRISGFLENHLVRERKFNKFVYLSFEL